MLCVNLGLLSNRSLIVHKQAGPLSRGIQLRGSLCQQSLLSLKRITRCQLLSPRNLHLRHKSLITSRWTKPMNSSPQDILHFFRFCWNFVSSKYVLILLVESQPHSKAYGGVFPYYKEVLDLDFLTRKRDCSTRTVGSRRRME